MITTLYKFPWYAVDYITMTDRRGLYECTAALLRILMESLRRPSKTFSSLEPTTALLQELVVAALSCPGFSEKQKYVIVQKLYEHDFRSIAEGAHTNMKLGGHFQLSGCWPFLALSPVPGTDPDLLKVRPRSISAAHMAPTNFTTVLRRPPPQGCANPIQRFRARPIGQDLTRLRPQHGRPHPRTGGRHRVGRSRSSSQARLRQATFPRHSVCKLRHRLWQLHHPRCGHHRQQQQWQPQQRNSEVTSVLVRTPHSTRKTSFKHHIERFSVLFLQLAGLARKLSNGCL